MIVQRCWTLASFRSWAHTVVNSPLTIAVWHQATPFCYLLLLPSKQNTSKFYQEPKWQLLAREARSSFQQSVPSVGQYRPNDRNHVEVIWFLFHFNHQSQRKTNNVHVSQLSSVVCFTPGCLGRDRTTNVASVVSRNDASEFLSFQFVHFLFSQTTKMENNRRVDPASLCDLDKERSPGSLISAEEQTASSLAQSFYGISFGLILAQTRRCSLPL